MQVRGTRPGRDPVPRGRAVVGVGLGGGRAGVWGAEQWRDLGALP